MTWLYRTATRSTERSSEKRPPGLRHEALSMGKADCDGLLVRALQASPDLQEWPVLRVMAEKRSRKEHHDIAQNTAWRKCRECRGDGSEPGAYKKPPFPVPEPEYPASPPTLA